MILAQIIPVLAQAAPEAVKYQSALETAFKNLTPEGKITMSLLVILSLISWTVMITKFRQLLKAKRMSRQFFTAFRASRNPLDILQQKQTFDGAPAYEVYITATEELEYHLKRHPVESGGRTKVGPASFDFIRASMERTVSFEGMNLERSMIILSTAVAGGPFLGLLGTVYGIMETFAGIARANAATLTAMAPGVSGALINTVAGLLVAIPAMFAYNFMVTQIRNITQELDDFASEYSTQIENIYVDASATHVTIETTSGPAPDAAKTATVKA
ncbi:MAG: MotA/TolQ/ExbB proton channel family protein [Verrucomicrobiota bacterium]